MDHYKDDIEDFSIVASFGQYIENESVQTVGYLGLTTISMYCCLCCCCCLMIYLLLRK
jgi:hypothetical protein